ncbi:MAG: metallophosphoesterase [Mycobacterium sp.]
MQALANLLEDSGVDLDNLIDVGRIDKISGGTWTTGMKVRDADGNESIEYAEQSRAGWVISPSWEDGPKWPVLQPGPTFNVQYQKPSGTGNDDIKPSDGWRSIVCLPDMQAPFHCERAADIALEIVGEIQPNVVVLHGDNLDLESMSRFRQHPSFAGGAQLAIDYMTLFCAELRSAAGPDAEIVWIQGNHEQRLENYALDNAAASFGLKKGKHPNKEWKDRPNLSVPELCELDESGVTYLEGYPANHYWFQDNVRIVHGHYTGQSAHTKYLAEGVTTVFGHTHHRIWAEKVLADGRLIHAISPGALCSVDGTVPGQMTGYDFDGPVRQPVNWQQGVLVGYGDGDQFIPEMVPIRGGRAMFRGRLLGV